MKKIGFVMQVLVLIIALPLLSILELNHANQKFDGKKAGSLVIAHTEKSAGISI